MRLARSETTAVRADIRTSVKMVLVPAHVTDPNGFPVDTLKRGDFHLFEDDVEQRIESFSVEQAPASIGIVFDSSGSMKNKLDRSFQAVDQFLKASLPGDEFFLVQFSDRPHMRVSFTRDADEIMSNLNLIQPEGWTAMLDAMYLGVQKMRTAQNARKALLVLSDGGDNNSRYSEGEILSLLRESDVQIYAIGLFDNARFLKKAAAETGGRIVLVHNLNDLPEAVDKLSSELRSQYLLGYYSGHERTDGKFHRLKVQLSESVKGELRASWRHGYFAPY
jgi:VWFA-related protein